VVQQRRRLRVRGSARERLLGPPPPPHRHFPKIVSLVRDLTNCCAEIPPSTDGSLRRNRGPSKGVLSALRGSKGATIVRSPSRAPDAEHAPSITNTDTRRRLPGLVGSRLAARKQRPQGRHRRRRCRHHRWTRRRCSSHARCAPGCGAHRRHARAPWAADTPSRRRSAVDVFLVIRQRGRQ
jgi:hypothetical protein